MRKQLTVALIIIVVLGGLYAAARIRAPEPPPPTTQEIWKQEGIPVEVAAITRGNMEQTVQVTGDIKALDEVTLSAKIPGRVAAVSAREGDPISRGQTVILLDQSDAASGLDQARANLLAAKARLSQAQTNAVVTKTQTDAAIEEAKAGLDAAIARFEVVKDPARSQERMVAANDVASAKANLDNAEANYKRHQQLLKDGAISQASYELVETQYRVAQAQYKSAQQRLSLIEEGGRSEDVKAAQAQVDMAKERLRAAKANASQNLLRQEDIKSARAAVAQTAAGVSLAQQQLNYTRVSSPISGVLASRLTEPGQVVAPGQALASAVNLNTLYFKGEVSEKELAAVRKGQSVEVAIDALPGRTFSGLLDEVYPAGSEMSRSFPVRIKMVSPGAAIRPGMFARGRIVTGLSRNVILVPKDAIEERRGTQMVFSVRSKPAPKAAGRAAKGRLYSAKRHDVEVLNENREYVEIARPTDLKRGDLVVTRGRQNLQDGSKLSIKGSQD